MDCIEVKSTVPSVQLVVDAVSRLKADSRCIASYRTQVKEYPVCN